MHATTEWDINILEGVAMRWVFVLYHGARILWRYCL